MAVETNTALDQREIRSDGTIQLRFAKQIKNGNAIISSQWHRATIPPGCDIDQMVEAVSRHLSEMGFPAVSAEDVAKIKASAELEWTPEVIAAYQSAQAALEANAH